MMYEWMDGGMGWGGMIFGPLIFIGFIALVVYLVVLLARAGSTPVNQRDAPPARSPLEILEERYARGEVDTQEFEERKSRLKGGK